MKTDETIRPSCPQNWAQLSRDYEHKVFSVTAFPAQKARIVDNVRLGRTVDLGCGPTGRLLTHLAGVQGVFPIGLDACAEMLIESRKATANLPVTYLQADMKWLPFANGSVETAISINSFIPETRTEAERMFREAARIVRPGGRLVAVLPAFEMSILARDCWGMQVSLDLDQHRECDTTGWQTFYTRTDIKELILKCGFSSVSIERMEFSTGPEIAQTLEVYADSLRGVPVETLVRFPLFEYFVVAEG
jgi:SAM-dependent methyltransferase